MLERGTGGGGAWKRSLEEVLLLGSELLEEVCSSEDPLHNNMCHSVEQLVLPTAGLG